MPFRLIDRRGVLRPDPAADIGQQTVQKPPRPMPRPAASQPASSDLAKFPSQAASDFWQAVDK